MVVWLAPLIAVLALAAVLVPLSVRIIKEYQRGVIFRLGRLVGAPGPGLFFLVPLAETMTKVDLRIATIDVPAQEAITRDNVTIKVNAVVYFRILDPEAAIVKVADFTRATREIAQTTLRSVLGQSELDDLVTARDQLNQQLQQIITERTEPWGIKVTAVEIDDVELPESMQRAMARQAEAERERRAKVIHAEGEYQAAQRLADASQIMSTQPAALQLRYLQTLTEIATEKTNTVIFPLPIDLLQAFLSRKDDSGNDPGSA